MQEATSGLAAKALNVPMEDYRGQASVNEVAAHFAAPIEEADLSW